MENKNLYQCQECGFHYKSKELAEKCENWCREHKTCNVEITRGAEENQVSNSTVSRSELRPTTGIELDTKKDLEELEELKQKCEDYLNNWKRAAADLENYKKGEAERMGDFAKYIKEGTILNILPILDSINLAQKHSHILENVRMFDKSNEVAEWLKGFGQIKKQIEDFLAKESIEEIKTEGEKFNPNFHEAVGEAGHSEASAKDASPGLIVEELQKGYTISGKVIRPAKVKVSK